MAENSKDNPSQDDDVRSCSPSDLSEAELATCVAIIKNGDAVDPASAERELPLATALAIVRRGATIVGVGAIKRVRHKYAAEIAARVESPSIEALRSLVTSLLTPTTGGRAFLTALLRHYSRSTAVHCSQLPTMTT